MASKLSAQLNQDHNKTYDNLKKQFIYEYPMRRKSCYCNLCGTLGHFQSENSNLPTLKELQFNIIQSKRRKQSFGDEIRTEIPSEYSQIESDDGRLITQQKRSISIVNMGIKGSLKIISLSRETNIKAKRKSCECSECGKLNLFQIKNQELSIPRKYQKIKQFQIKRQRKFHQYGSTEFQVNNKKIIQKSIMSSPKSQRSFQVKQINEMRRTKDVTTLINNRISTRDLEQPKQIQNKFQIINSCRQFDSPQILQVKSQRKNTLKPAISLTNIKWKIQ